MPKIWAGTIENHRQQVHDAILTATAELIAERGPMSVAMSAIAERAGVGRATLYKYFPDVDAVLMAWHHRESAANHDRLNALVAAESPSLGDLTDLVLLQRERLRRYAHADAIGPLAAMVALTTTKHDAGKPVAAHAEEVVGGVIHQLSAVLLHLAELGEVRADQPPQVLAEWLVHATHAPSTLDDAAVAELITASLAPPAQKPSKQSRKVATSN
jgi:AcrR family transcriptional regulator